MWRQQYDLLTSEPVYKEMNVFLILFHWYIKVSIFANFLLILVNHQMIFNINSQCYISIFNPCMIMWDQFEDKLVLLVKLKLVINFINKKDREYLKNHDIKIKKKTYLLSKTSFTKSNTFLKIFLISMNYSNK